jgi:hypothetical protein
VRPPRRPQIQVIVSASTLLHQDEEPGWLEHYGPIHADLARELAHDPTGNWRRLLTDPTTGHLLDYGRRTYTPPRHLHDYITARDGTCTFPTCTISAHHADLDHIVTYPHGPTSHHNLTAAHRRHHNAKTHGGWSIHLNPDTGHITWTSPHGRRYHHQPPERWHTPHPQPPTPEPASGQPTAPEPPSSDLPNSDLPSSDAAGHDPTGSDLPSSDVASSHVAGHDPTGRKPTPSEPTREPPGEPTTVRAAPESPDDDCPF